MLHSSKITTIITKVYSSLKVTSNTMSIHCGVLGERMDLVARPNFTVHAQQGSYCRHSWLML